MKISMRLHELAKELGVKSQDLLDRIQKWGFEVKSTIFAPVEPSMVEQIRGRYHAESAGGPAASPVAKPPSRPARPATPETPAIRSTAPAVPKSKTASPALPKAIPARSPLPETIQSSIVPPVSQSLTISDQANDKAKIKLAGPSVTPTAVDLRGAKTLLDILMLNDTSVQVPALYTLFEAILRNFYPGVPQKDRGLLRHLFQSNPAWLVKVHERELNRAVDIRNMIIHPSDSGHRPPNDPECLEARNAFVRAIRDLIRSNRLSGNDFS